MTDFFQKWHTTGSEFQALLKFPLSQSEAGRVRRNSMQAWWLLLILPFGLGGCAIFSRSNGSGYYDSAYDSGVSARYDRENSTRQDAVSEMGWDGRELSDGQRAAVENRITLKQLEKGIVGRREKEQYYRFKPMMDSDRERIAFLRLSSYEARQRWLNARGINLANPRYSSEVSHLIEQNDIMIGMPKPAVRESWGEPESIEVAGNPLYGNERWKYVEQISSQDGFQTETRLVYFESGRVVGWEKAK